LQKPFSLQNVLSIHVEFDSANAYKTDNVYRPTSQQTNLGSENVSFWFPERSQNFPLRLRLTL